MSVLQAFVVAAVARSCNEASQNKSNLILLSKEGHLVVRGTKYTENNTEYTEYKQGMHKKAAHHLSTMFASQQQRTVTL